MPHALHSFSTSLCSMFSAQHLPLHDLCSVLEHSTLCTPCSVLCTLHSMLTALCSVLCGAACSAALLQPMLCTLCSSFILHSPLCALRSSLFSKLLCSFGHSDLHHSSGSCCCPFCHPSCAPSFSVLTGSSFVFHSVCPTVPSGQSPNLPTFTSLPPPCHHCGLC